MAYMDQEKKAIIAAKLKLIVPKDWKYSLSVSNSSTITCTISKAPINLMEGSEERGYRTINPFRISAKDGPQVALPIYKSILEALNTDNHDRSDSMTDYFDVGHYVQLEVGRWNKPFEMTGVKPMSILPASNDVRATALASLLEVQAAVFGDGGDAPDVYAVNSEFIRMGDLMRMAIQSLQPGADVEVSASTAFMLADLLEVQGAVFGDAKHVADAPNIYAADYYTVSDISGKMLLAVRKLQSTSTARVAVAPEAANADALEVDEEDAPSM